MKRHHELGDASDRAQKARKHGELRVPLDKIGVWPGNRGGLGLSSHRARDVAWDCMANKTKLQRYGHVNLIEINAAESTAMARMRFARQQFGEKIGRIPKRGNPTNGFIRTRDTTDPTFEQSVAPIGKKSNAYPEKTL